MALTAAQRKRLPSSAFVYPGSRKYPVPTKAQAAKAGISERQRLALHRNALSRAAQPSTMGTPSKVRAAVKRRSAGKVKPANPSKPRASKRGASSKPAPPRRR